MIVTCVTTRYLPNLRYLARLAEADRAVVLDLAPVSDSGSFVNRNRLKDRTRKAGGWVTVPIMRHRGVPVREIQVNPTDHRWPSKHIHTVELLYPEHRVVAPDFVGELADRLRRHPETLLDNNCNVLAMLLSTLSNNIDVPSKQSALVGSHTRHHRLDVARALGATTYLAGEVEWLAMDRSGDLQAFEDANVRVIQSPSIPKDRFDADAVITYSVANSICTIGLDGTRHLLTSLVDYLRKAGKTAVEDTGAPARV